MLVIKNIREKKEEYIKLLKIKNFDATDIFNNIILLDDKRKTIQKELDNLLFTKKEITNDIKRLYENVGNEEIIKQKKENVTFIKNNINTFNNTLNATKDEIKKLLLTIPNVPHHTVKEGNINEIIKTVGIIPELDDDSESHWVLAKKYNIVDFEAGNKITGAGFPLYKGKGAKLQRALINFFLDEAEKNGYNEVQPPILVNKESVYATGQLPDKDEQMYHISLDDLYLIPTAEVPITNIFRDTIIDKLPIKTSAYSPCFRREAGSYGADVRGLNRLHQFDKVELVVIEEPEKSYDRLQEMLNYVESLLVKLELPYRLLKLSGGDTSFTAALTYDLEVYSAAQKKWLEVSSVSNFETYQANRLKLRRKKDKNLLHTLNGSALALPRIVAALLENNQTLDGIKIPKALIPYTGFNYINK
jgi:seryl-tRNA synthetase